MLFCVCLHPDLFSATLYFRHSVFVTLCLSPDFSISWLFRGTGDAIEASLCKAVFFVTSNLPLTLLEAKSSVAAQLTRPQIGGSHSLVKRAVQHFYGLYYSKNG